MKVINKPESESVNINLAKDIQNVIKMFQSNPTEENLHKVNELTKKLVNAS